MALSSNLPDRVDFAVLGNPISHSLSPRIHAQFAASVGIRMDYQAIDVDPSELSAALAHWYHTGARGFNVTLPHKQAVIACCSTLSARAQDAQAVNTLIRTNTGWHGDNTDGCGFMRDLQTRHRFDLGDARVLLLGAGGAARGVLSALLQAPIASVVLVNRTTARAEQLVDAMRDKRCRTLSAETLMHEAGFDLLINASGAAYTAPDQATAWPALTLSSRAVLYDLSYGPTAKPLLRWASELEVVGLDGLGMLVEQAAEAFYVWHERRVDSEPVWAALRAYF